MKKELTYRKAGEYWIPNLQLQEISPKPLGKYGRMRRSYLREYRPLLYNRLILQEQLFPHLYQVEEQATERMNRMIAQFKRAEGVTEELKAADPMEWVRCMNSIQNRAEEIVKAELIYS